MSEKTPLKSAYELAMERLQSQDREAGVEKSLPLTDDQKRTIAELRQTAKAKLAELEILHRKDRASVLAEPEKLTEMEERYTTDRRRVESSLESAIHRVRQGKEPGPIG